MNDSPVERTIEGLGNTEYEPEARARWGGDAVDRSNEAWRALGPDGQQEHMAKHVRVAQGIAGLAAEYAEPSSPAVQAVVARHYEWISLFWTPDRTEYEALADMYVDDHRFRANYDKFGDGTAELLRDAIKVWANANLE
ncbi:MAG: TipAS antibiotic-recognition domain-containing protein [Demequinaceae bacterium]|nr:TipAS antibiotic-recognition domain-containing protein [Demequinaceae bacterium]